MQQSMSDVEVIWSNQGHPLPGRRGVEANALTATERLLDGQKPETATGEFSLSYCFIWSWRTDSNRRPADYKTAATALNLLLSAYHFLAYLSYIIQ